MVCSGGGWAEDRKEGCWQFILRKTLPLPELLQSLADLRHGFSSCLHSPGFLSPRQQEGVSRKKRHFRSTLFRVSPTQTTGAQLAVSRLYSSSNVSMLKGCPIPTCSPELARNSVSSKYSQAFYSVTIPSVHTVENPVLILQTVPSVISLTVLLLHVGTQAAHLPTLSW